MYNEHPDKEVTAQQMPGKPILPGSEACYFKRERHDAVIAAQAREATMDEFGILHGDDAKRFNDYINSDDKCDTPAGAALVQEAYKQYQNERIVQQDRDNFIKETERNRIVGDGIAAIQKRIDGIYEAYHDETNEELKKHPYAVILGMDEAIKILKSISIKPTPSKCPAGGCVDEKNCPDACRVKKREQ